MAYPLNKFTCINCGAKVKELYKKYSESVLKLVNCENCQSASDKYIEYDLVIVIIDLILLRKEAYRHMLYNTPFQAHWKLAVILQLMEAYSEWILMSSATNIRESETFTDDFTGRDIQFYILCMRVMFRTFSFITSIFLLTLIYNSFVKRYENVRELLVKVWKAIILSNFGLFLLLPSLIWDKSLQEFHLTFVSLYTTLSQLLAYTVVCNCSKIWSIIVIVLSYNCKVISNEVCNAGYNFLVNSVNYTGFNFLLVPYNYTTW